MTHIYSDLLIAYLFNEIDPDSKKLLENELVKNAELIVEFNELKAGLGVILEHKPMSPDARIVQHILDSTSAKEIIPAD